MANISEQCACVYVTRGGGVFSFWWGKEKKRLSKFADCSFIVLASCLESQDEIYPWCVPSVSKWRSRASKFSLSNAPFPSSHGTLLHPFMSTRLWPQMLFSPNAHPKYLALLSRGHSPACIALGSIYHCVCQFFSFEGKCQIPPCCFFGVCVHNCPQCWQMQLDQVSWGAAST